MADFKQTVSNFLCNIAGDIKRLRVATEKGSGSTDDFSISVPEKGGSIEFSKGNTIIDFNSGTYTKPDGEVVQLENSLSKKGFDKMSSFAIGADKLFHYKVYGLERRIIDANYTDHINNTNFSTVIVTCNQDTNIQLRASTNPHPDMGLSPNYKINEDGKQHVISNGSQGDPFSQCEHGKIRTLDVYHYQIEHGDRDTKVGYMDGIGEAAFAVLANAVYAQPTDDIQMEVVSDSVEDDVGGTGAEHLRITYFSKMPWTKYTTDVIMDGTTIVNTTATDMYRIESIEVIKGNPAVGTITLKDTSGVTLYGQINPLRTYMERAMHYIETGKRCVATDFVVSTQTKEGIIFRIFKTQVFGTDLVTSGRYSATILESVLPQSFNIPVVIENPDGLRMAVGFAVLGLAAAQGGSGSFRYYDEDI